MCLCYLKNNNVFLFLDFLVIKSSWVTTDIGLQTAGQVGTWRMIPFDNKDSTSDLNIK